MQTQKILGLLGVIIALIAIIALSQLDMFTQTSPTKSTKEGDPIEAYKKLKTDIEQLKKVAWSKDAYNLRKKNLEEYAESAILTPTQIKELKGLLNDTYLPLLQDTILGFCRYGSDLNIFQNLQQAAQILEKEYGQATKLGKMKQALEEYQKFLNTCQAINAYTASQPYNAAASEQYKTDIEYYSLKSDYLSQNKYLDEEAIKYAKRLQTLLGLSKQINICLNNIDRCNCKDFIENTYYYALCNTEKEKRKEQKK